jgi:hypothetical protein
MGSALAVDLYCLAMQKAVVQPVGNLEVAELATLLESLPDAIIRTELRHCVHLVVKNSDATRCDPSLQDAIDLSDRLEKVFRLICKSRRDARVVDDNTTNRFRTFLLIFCGIFFAAAGSLLYEARQDHFSAISLAGDGNWYRNFKQSNFLGVTRRDIQDRDILFHDIGRSVSNARAADIILLGHSMMNWGMDWRTLEVFQKKHGIRIFNLASAGDASGEFLLQIIRKHRLHPRLWVINVDDTGASFFAASLDTFGNFGKSAANVVVTYSKWQALKNVLGRNVLWRLWGAARVMLPPSLSVRLAQDSVITYRSSAHGNWFLDTVPAYVSREQPVIKNTRDPNCPAQARDLEGAHKYAESIAGDIVFTQVPHSNSCRQWVRDIANYLDKPAILVDDAGIKTMDNGGHLNAEGAKVFTERFLLEFEKTRGFQKLIAATRLK